MKKIIELALKSREITFDGIMDLVNCLDANQQERAVLILTENQHCPEDFTVGEVIKEGNYIYTAVKYNFLTEKVICDSTYSAEGKTTREGRDIISWYRWTTIRDNMKKAAEKTKAQNAN